MAELAVRDPITRVAIGIFVVMSAATVPAAPAGTAGYRIDPAKSRVTIHVGKTGALSFVAGHTHEVSGPIEGGSVDVDPETPSRSHVRLSIAPADLTVSAAGEPEGDEPKVQEAMQSEKVLGSQRFPKITYESTAVTLKSKRETRLELGLTGNLTIRDVSQSVVVPVEVEIGGSELSARGRFEIRQTAFGIKPISIGGVVNVKDTIAIDFTIVAARVP